MLHILHVPLITQMLKNWRLIRLLLVGILLWMGASLSHGWKFSNHVMSIWRLRIPANVGQSSHSIVMAKSLGHVDPLLSVCWHSEGPSTAPSTWSLQQRNYLTPWLVLPQPLAKSKMIFQETLCFPCLRISWFQGHLDWTCVCPLWPSNLLTPKLQSFRSLVIVSHCSGSMVAVPCTLWAFEPCSGFNGHQAMSYDVLLFLFQFVFFFSFPFFSLLPQWMPSPFKPPTCKLLLIFLGDGGFQSFMVGRSVAGSLVFSQMANFFASLDCLVHGSFPSLSHISHWGKLSFCEQPIWWSLRHNWSFGAQMHCTVFICSLFNLWKGTFWRKIFKCQVFGADNQLQCAIDSVINCQTTKRTSHSGVLLSEDPLGFIMDTLSFKFIVIKLFSTFLELVSLNTGENFHFWVLERCSSAAWVAIRASKWTTFSVFLWTSPKNDECTWMFCSQKTWIHRTNAQCHTHHSSSSSNTHLTAEIGSSSFTWSRGGAWNTLSNNLAELNATNCASHWVSSQNSSPACHFLGEQLFIFMAFQSSKITQLKVWFVLKCMEIMTNNEDRSNGSHNGVHQPETGHPTDCLFSESEEESQGITILAEQNHMIPFASCAMSWTSQWDTFLVQHGAKSTRKPRMWIHQTGLQSQRTRLEAPMSIQINLEKTCFILCFGGTWHGHQRNELTPTHISLPVCFFNDKLGVFWCRIVH